MKKSKSYLILVNVSTMIGYSFRKKNKEDGVLVFVVHLLFSLFDSFHYQ